MIVVIVRDNDSIDDGDILNLAGYFRVSLRAQPRKWRTTRRENRIEQYSETAREFHVVASVPQPGRAEMFRSARCKE